MNGLNIKKATQQELRQIQKIDRLTLGDESRKAFLADRVKNGRCLAASNADKVTGFGILDQSFYGQNFIALLIVHPDYRRQGIATALIRRMESICRTKKIFTSTNKSNIPAQKTYESLGFVRSGYIENLDVGDPEIIYFKLLTGGGAGGTK